MIHGVSITSAKPSVWSECRCVMKPILRFIGSKALTPLLRAAAARLTTPVPRSTRYGVPLTTIAVQGPERSGSGNGVPVPKKDHLGLWRGFLVCHRWPKARRNEKDHRNRGIDSRRPALSQIGLAHHAFPDHLAPPPP